MSFHLTCVHIIFSSVWVAEWPPLGKYLLARLTICSLCILTICNLVIFRFGFEGWIWVLVAQVPGLCILFTFTVLKLRCQPLTFSDQFPYNFRSEAAFQSII